MTSKSNMNDKMRELCPVGSFALACEQLNDFARSLRESSRFATVRAGADIRFYESGWKLEKWVEAELDRDEGSWAAWWLELGPNANGWKLDSHISISHGALLIGMEERSCTTLDALERNLATAVEELTHALERNDLFAQEVSKRTKTKPVGNQ
jgi:hypothetical protein